MAKLLKAMKRPAALWGVPMVPLLAVTGITIIIAVWTSVAFLALSGNPYADEVSRLYYASLEANPFRRNRLFLTACYRPFASLEKAGHRRMKDGQKLKELDGALQEMLEIKGTLDTALSRYAAHSLGSQYASCIGTGDASFLFLDNLLLR